MYTRNYKPNLFATRTMKKKNPGIDAKEKIKSKLFVLDKKKSKDAAPKIKIPKSLIAPVHKNPGGIKDIKTGISKGGKKGKNDEKHYHLHLYHHFTKDKNSKANDTEPSKTGSKVSGTSKPRAHTESRDGDTQTTAEVGAVTGVSEVQRKNQKNQFLKDIDENGHRRKVRSKGRYVK